MTVHVCLSLTFKSTVSSADLLKNSYNSSFFMDWTTLKCRVIFTIIIIHAFAGKKNLIRIKTMTPFIGIKHLKFLSISMRHKLTLTFGFLYFDIHYIHVHMFDLTFLTRCRITSSSHLV